MQFDTRLSKVVVDNSLFRAFTVSIGDNRIFLRYKEESLPTITIGKQKDDRISLARESSHFLQRRNRTTKTTRWKKKKSNKLDEKRPKGYSNLSFHRHGLLLPFFVPIFFLFLSIWTLSSLGIAPIAIEQQNNNNNTEIWASKRWKVSQVQHRSVLYTFCCQDLLARWMQDEPVIKNEPLPH